MSSVLTTTRPGKIVYLSPSETAGALQGYCARDERIIHKLARKTPVTWSDLLRGAIDQGWAIRVAPRRMPHKGGKGRGPKQRPEPSCRMVLAVSENRDLSRYEVYPLGEEDRQRLLALFPEYGMTDEMPRPSMVFSRAVKAGIEVTVRCDLRVIR